MNAFHRYQCKKIEENNRMGKTRDPCKKIRDTKGTFHVKMGLIKDRNGMDLTEAEDNKKRRQEYTELRRLSTEELMLLNCGVGEDSLESLGLQGEPTSPF